MLIASPQTVKERAARDTAFAKAMLDEAATLFLNGEPHTARLILRDLVNASVGFETLAAETNGPSKSLHRMCPRRAIPAWTISPPSSAGFASASRGHPGARGRGRISMAKKRRKAESAILALVWETVAGLRDVGIVDTATMCDFDAMARDRHHGLKPIG